MPNAQQRTPEPGDSDFDWSQYGAYRQANPDPVIGAKDFLARNGLPVAQAMIDAPASAATSPALGERRTVNGETRQWTGTRFAPVSAASAPASVDNPISFGMLDYVPGLNDAMNLGPNLVKGAQALPDVARGLWNNPGATLKGFAGGASEALTPGRAGLLALLTGGATLPATAGAAGLELAGEAGRELTDAPNAASSFSQAAGRAAEAASIPGLPAVAKYIPGALQKVPGVVGTGLRKVGGGGLGATVGAAEGYRRGGVTGALEGAALGAGVGGSLKLPGRLGRALNGLADAGTVPENGSMLGEIQPLASPVRGGFSREVPGSSYRPSTSPINPGIDELPQSTLSMVDRYMPNSGGAEPLTNPSAASSRISYGDHDPEASVSAIVDRYMPNSGGVEPIASSAPISQAVPYSASGSPTPVDSTLALIEREVAAGRQPRSVLDLYKRNREWDSILGRTQSPATAQTATASLTSAVRGLSDFTYEAGDANRPGMSAGNVGPVSTLPRSQSPATAAAPRVLPRGDSFWGPGATTRAGLPAQADASGANLLFDPQTPTAYLRKQLSMATNPADREFLARAIDQRYRMQRAVSGLAGR